MSKVPYRIKSKFGLTYYEVEGKMPTPELNAIDFLEVYEKAKSKKPNVNNIIEIIINPGIYKFNKTFIHDQPYINLISITNLSDVYFNGLIISCNNTKVVGINTSVGNYPIIVHNNLNKLICKNCTGGDFSFGFLGDKRYKSLDISGKFYNCIGGDYSFCGGELSNTNLINKASGLFEYCKAGKYSFGFAGDASGEFYNCTADDYSFGNIATGRFVYIKTGKYSIGGYGKYFNGIAISSEAGYNSYGGENGKIDKNARILKCSLLEGSYGTFNTKSSIIGSIDGYGNLINNTGNDNIIGDISHLADKNYVNKIIENKSNGDYIDNIKNIDFYNLYNNNKNIDIKLEEIFNTYIIAPIYRDGSDKYIFNFNLNDIINNTINFKLILEVVDNNINIDFKNTLFKNNILPDVSKKGVYVIEFIKLTNSTLIGWEINKKLK